MTRRDHETVPSATHRWAGCPDVLEVDLPDQDIGVRTTDWLEGPPTAARHGDAGADEEADVTSLTTTRATRLLDATIAHVHAAMESTSAPAARHKLDRAVADLSRARNTLLEVTEAETAPH